MTRRPPPSQGGIGTSEEPRMRVSKEQAAQNRKQILTAAARLFRENGIRATGVDSISQGAGLTHGAFYSQFDSKEALAAEAIRLALSRSKHVWQRMAERRRGSEAFRSIVARPVEVVSWRRSGRASPVSLEGFEQPSPRS